MGKRKASKIIESHPNEGMAVAERTDGMLEILPINDPVVAEARLDLGREFEHDKEILSERLGAADEKDFNEVAGHLRTVVRFLSAVNTLLGGDFACPVCREGVPNGLDQCPFCNGVGHMRPKRIEAVLEELPLPQAVGEGKPSKEGV